MPHAEPIHALGDARAGRADGNQRPPRCRAGHDIAQGFHVKGKVLVVHVVVGDTLNGDRAEGPRGHVQRQPGRTNASGGELVEDGVGEVEARGGRGHAAAFGGVRVDGLVPGRDGRKGWKGWCTGWEGVRSASRSEEREEQRRRGHWANGVSLQTNIHHQCASGVAYCSVSDGTASRSR